jgi:hypothetical protein
MHIQNVPGGKIKIVGGHGIGYSKKKKLYMSMCPIPNGFRNNIMDFIAHIKEH